MRIIIRMKKALILTTLLIAAAAFFATASAQSGRTQTKSEGKLNRRESTPTPTPVAVLPPVETEPIIDDGEVIKVNTQLVSVPVRVMDKKGRFIGGLARESFRVFENGVEQEVALFSNEHQPFTVALVLDMSYSTTFRITEIQSAAIAFIEQLRPEDKVMVISFAEEVHMLCEATNDRKAIYRAIKSTKIATGTSLYEAVDMTMNQRLRGIEGRKAIILFSDGVDTTSRRAHDRDNLNDAVEMDALIYPIRYDTFADVQRMSNGVPVELPPIAGIPIPLPPVIVPTTSTPNTKGTTAEEYKNAEEYLDQLATRTGGRIYQANSLGNLAEAYSKIASELREFYSIGYYPQDDPVAGKKREVKVKVDRPGVVVRSRETFIRRKK